MDSCPNCGSRLTGEPTWCPRCLSRFDGAAATASPARQFADLWASVKAEPAPAAAAPSAPPAAAGPPPSMYTPYTPPAPPAPHPSVAAPAATPVAPAAGPAAGHHIPRTVITAIGLGVVLQVVDYVLTRGLHLKNPTAVGLGLGLTLAFYLVVLSLVQGRLYEGKVQPVWHIGSPGPGALVGIGVGAALAFLVILANSALAGHLTSDATAMMVFAQGGLIRVLMLVVVTVVCAPFIEELLFRGLLAESMRPRGRGAAIWLSALAFALWHLRPELLRYYLLIGALLGLLYWKRGLVCSMSAHATFNGLLTVVAALAVTGAAHTVAGAGVTLRAPAGWQQVTSAAGGPDEPGLALHSPSGASVFVERLEVPAILDPNAVAARMNAVPTLGPGVVVKAGTVHAVEYPAGAGASAEVDDNGQDADAVVISSRQGTVIAELLTGGNSNARPQFESMLQSLQIG